MLTPLEVETTVFRRAWRGYSCEEVREFMAHISADYETLHKENHELKEQIEALDEKLSQYMRLEDNMRNALVLGQQAAEETKVAAAKQGELILREAEIRAEQLRNRMRDELNGEFHRLTDLRQRTEQARAQLRSILLTHLELLDRQLPQPAQSDEIRPDQPASPQQAV